MPDEPQANCRQHRSSGSDPRREARGAAPATTIFGRGGELDRQAFPRWQPKRRGLHHHPGSRQLGDNVLKQRTAHHADIDMDGITVAKADLAVEDTRVESVIMGEAYIQRDKTDKVHRFLCLTGPQGKVLMTFFTQR